MWLCTLHQGTYQHSVTQSVPAPLHLCGRLCGTACVEFSSSVILAILALAVQGSSAGRWCGQHLYNGHTDVCLAGSSDRRSESNAVVVCYTPRFKDAKQCTPAALPTPLGPGKLSTGGWCSFLYTPGNRSQKAMPCLPCNWQWLAATGALMANRWYELPVHCGPLRLQLTLAVCAQGWTQSDVLKAS